MNYPKKLLTSALEDLESTIEIVRSTIGEDELKAIENNRIQLIFAMKVLAMFDEDSVADKEYLGGLRNKAITYLMSIEDDVSHIARIVNIDTHHLSELIRQKIVPLSIPNPIGLEG